MPDPSRTSAHGVDVLTTRSPDGAELDVTAHGGHVLGWRPVSGGERLWTSSLAAPPSLRGGVPVVFPQFAERGPLPKHGLARDRPWEVVAVGGGRAMLALRDDAATRVVWPHAFSAELTAEVVADRLEVDLTVSNTGNVPWAFTAALHAYLAVAGPPVVQGLGGRPYERNADPGRTLRLAEDDLAVVPPLDVAVRGADDPRRLLGGAHGDLVLTTGGFRDTVVWNPGTDCPADVPGDEVDRFLCVEPAVLTPVVLGPGSVWRGSLRLRAAGSGDDRVDDPNGVQPGE